jgi:hypothetical protein
MKRSRYGFTRCPKCGSHVQPEELTAIGCAFCTRSSIVTRSRAGVVAASLLALSACGSDDGNETPPTDHGSDTTGGEDPVDPIDPPPPDDPDGDPPDDYGPVAEYGVPPESE